MPSILPPLASAHRQRWQRVGELFARLQWSSEPLMTSALTVTPVLISSPVPPSEAVPEEVSAPMQRPIVPVSIIALDPKRERAELFFRALSWNRVGLQAVSRPPAPEEEMDEPHAAATTEQFFSREVPWAGRQTQPQAPQGRRDIGAGLDLKFLLAAATAQAVQTSRRARGTSSTREHLEIEPGQAEYFFRQINWSIRGAKVD